MVIRNTETCVASTTFMIFKHMSIGLYITGIRHGMPSYDHKQQISTMKNICIELIKKGHKYITKKIFKFLSIKFMYNANSKTIRPKPKKLHMIIRKKWDYNQLKTVMYTEVVTWRSS